MMVGAEALCEFVAALFRAEKLPADDARLVANVFILQEMRGITTHGLRRVPRNLRWLREGLANATPRRRVLRDRDAMVTLDGDHGIGILACTEAMQRAIGKARRFGMGIAVTINNNHFLSAAPYCLQAAENDMLGIAFSNTYAAMGYPGAAGRVLGNGPFGFAAPTAAGYPLVYDAAMSASYGKLVEWARRGESIPAYLPAMDARGAPTRDPQAALDGGTPLPMGMHKGGGLVLLIEILTGVIGGGAFLSAIQAPEARASKANGESHCCIAVDVAHFMPVAEFRERMAAFIVDLQSQPRAEGVAEIHVPGERAQRCFDECRQHGIPLEPDLAEELRDLAGMAKIDAPF